MVKLSLNLQRLPPAQPGAIVSLCQLLFCFVTSATCPPRSKPNNSDLLYYIIIYKRMRFLLENIKYLGMCWSNSI